MVMVQHYQWVTFVSCTFMDHYSAPLEYFFVKETDVDAAFNNLPFCSAVGTATERQLLICEEVGLRKKYYVPVKLDHLILWDFTPPVCSIAL